MQEGLWQRRHYKWGWWVGGGTHDQWQVVLCTSLARAAPTTGTPPPPPPPPLPPPVVQLVETPAVIVPPKLVHCVPLLVRLVSDRSISTIEWEHPETLSKVSKYLFDCSCLWRQKQEKKEVKSKSAKMSLKVPSCLECAQCNTCDFLTKWGHRLKARRLVYGNGIVNTVLTCVLCGNERARNFDSFWCSDYDPLLVSSHEQLLQLFFSPSVPIMILPLMKGGALNC